LASLNSAVDTTPCIALQPVAREVQRLGPPKRVGLGLALTIVHFDMFALARQVMRTGVGGVGVACGAMGRAAWWGGAVWWRGLVVGCTRLAV
jgi:hypothetical protein